MTARVAILAFTIMLAGRDGAADPRRRRRPRRLPRDGRGDGACSSASASWRPYVGTRRAPIGAVAAGAGSLREQLRIVATARDFRLLLTTFVLQALATGCMLAGVDYLAADVLDVQRRRDDPVRLLRRPGAAAHAAVGAVRRARRQEARATSCPRWSSRPVRRSPSSRRTRRPAVIFAATGLVGRGLRGLPGLPDGDAARRRRDRRRAHRREPRRRLHRRLDRGRDARAGARAGGLRGRAGPRRLRLVARAETSPSPARRGTAITLGFSLLPAALTLLSLLWLRRYTLDADAVARATTEATT